MDGTKISALRSMKGAEVKLQVQTKSEREPIQNSETVVYDFTSDANKVLDSGRSTMFSTLRKS
jgi:hypothetical protein